MSDAARPRWRLPPNRISAALTNPRAAALRPSTPSSPIPTMDSQRADAAVSCLIASGSDMIKNLARILILGGTTEARMLAEQLAGRRYLAVTRRRAARPVSPAPQPVPVRSGGFGGAAGLADHLLRQRIDALIDATHPYASRISANAVAAAHGASGPFVVLRRPPG